MYSSNFICKILDLDKSRLLTVDLTLFHLLQYCDIIHFHYTYISLRASPSNIPFNCFLSGWYFDFCYFCFLVNFWNFIMSLNFITSTYIYFYWISSDIIRFRSIFEQDLCLGTVTNIKNVAFIVL